MPAVKNVGEPCAGEPHARFEVAAGGNQTSRASTRRAVQAPLADPTKTPDDVQKPRHRKTVEPQALAKSLRAAAPRRGQGLYPQEVVSVSGSGRSRALLPRNELTAAVAASRTLAIDRPSANLAT